MVIANGLGDLRDGSEIMADVFHNFFVNQIDKFEIYNLIIIILGILFTILSFSIIIPIIFIILKSNTKIIVLFG